MSADVGISLADLAGAKGRPAITRIERVIVNAPNACPALSNDEQALIAKLVRDELANLMDRATVAVTEQPQPPTEGQNT